MLSPQGGHKEDKRLVPDITRLKAEEATRPIWLPPRLQQRPGPLATLGPDRRTLQQPKASQPLDRVRLSLAPEHRLELKIKQLVPL